MHQARKALCPVWLGYWEMAAHLQASGINVRSAALPVRRLQGAPQIVQEVAPCRPCSQIPTPGEE